MNNRISIRPLRSGSSGNIMLVEYADTVLLVDAGLPSQRGLVQALSESRHLACAPQRDGVLDRRIAVTVHINPGEQTWCAQNRIP